MGQRRILIVDDDPHVCRVMSYALGKAGYCVEAAYSAGEALASASAQPPELAVLDLGLPDGDGFLLCRKLKALLPHLRVVILTGRSSSEDSQQASAAGADEYMTKPFSPTALDRAIGRLLNETQHTDVRAHEMTPSDGRTS